MYVPLLCERLISCKNNTFNMPSGCFFFFFSLSSQNLRSKLIIAVWLCLLSHPGDPTLLRSQLELLVPFFQVQRIGWVGKKISSPSNSLLRALEWAAQSGYGCPVLRSVEVQAGWNPGQSALVQYLAAGGPAMVGTWWSLRSLPSQAILWFCDSFLRINHYEILKHVTLTHLSKIRLLIIHV